jgi:GntR family transcriptional regulator, transcriptional repressor for pyruvate dehydrogenase complex
MLNLESLKAPQRKSLQVAEALLENIRRGGIAAGDRLPPERELSEAFRVSRTVVREALNSLQLAGLIVRRVGDGTYVSEAASELAAQKQPLRKDLDAGASIVEAIEAREAMDLAVVKLALKNAQAQDLECLEGIISRMRVEVDRGATGAYIRLTLDLHRAIARAAGNSLLERLVGELIDIITPHIWIIERNYTAQIAETSFTVHKAMADAIRTRDHDAALAAVQQHYQQYPGLQKGCC